MWIPTHGCLFWELPFSVYIRPPDAFHVPTDPQILEIQEPKRLSDIVYTKDNPIPATENIFTILHTVFTA